VYLPVGDKIEIPVGKDWVSQFSSVRNKLAMIRGTRPGKRVTLSWGAIGFNYQVPKTTCADIKAGASTWVPKLIYANVSLPGGFSRPAKDLYELKDRLGLASFCAANPGAEFPENDLFWALAKRSAIEADSRNAIPSAWTLMWESVKESAAEFWDKMPDAPDIVPDIDWTKIMLWSVVGVGGYMLLKGKK
jgi:hypothetical protein